MKSNIARFSALATWLSVVVISVVAVFLFDRPSLQGNSPDSAKRLELSLSIQQAQTAPTPLPVVPCSPGVMQYGKQVDFNCTADTNNNFDWVMTATVTTSCPVNLVFRNPYPRTMVNLTTTFSLTGSQFYPSPNGAWSNLVSAEKDVNYSPSPRGRQWRNLQIGLRSRQFITPTSWLSTTAPIPQWAIQDRTWNGSRQFPTNQTGVTATFVYATSSYGLASRGRAFDFVNQKPSTLYNLPAYQVNVTTSCGHEWALRWQELITTTVSPGSPYAWTTKVITWQPLSLVTYGVTTPYAIQTQSQSGGVFNGTTYLDAQEGFWVPVIEVQSTLTNP